MLSARTALLLDFDGTLVNSAPGIVGCLAYAFSALSLPAPPEQHLRSVIGLPLEAGFQSLGLDQSQAARATAAYRAHWQAWGLDQWSLYPGVLATLATLRQRQVYLVLATAKHTAGVAQAVARVGLSDAFDAVCGAEPGEADKRPVVARALAHLSSDQRAQCAMVGDHRPDADAARAHGVPFICASYGYGDAQALAAFEPIRTLRQFADILEMI